MQATYAAFGAPAGGGRALAEVVVGRSDSETVPDPVSPELAEAPAGRRLSQVSSLTGPCVVNGPCLCSSNYQDAACQGTGTASGSYGNSESCTVTLQQPVTLTVHLFDTESGYTTN